ncbi:hypothetical protein ACX1NB_03430, partial [Mycoplasma sp. HF14]
IYLQKTEVITQKLVYYPFFLADSNSNASFILDIIIAAFSTISLVLICIFFGTNIIRHTWNIEINCLNDNLVFSMDALVYLYFTTTDSYFMDLCISIFMRQKFGMYNYWFTVINYLNRNSNLTNNTSNEKT